VITLDGAGQPDYVLGHSARELARLEQQAAFFTELTRDGLIRAGIEPGMRVLDLGCGVGDVSLIASDLVGPTGAVTGIDISPSALAIARARAAASDRPASFIAESLETFAHFADFDAVVGRFILVHFPDPAAAVAAVVKQLRHGTRVAFLEMDMSTAVCSAPFPLLDAQVARIGAVYDRLGLTPNMGLRLYRTFRAAGLTPTLRGATHVGHSGEAAGFAFLTESIRSLAPAMERLGVATADEIGIDTLFDRLVAAGAASDLAIFYPRFVTAWAWT
jgi:SAM-dependent methyltransferase